MVALTAEKEAEVKTLIFKVFDDWRAKGILDQPASLYEISKATDVAVADVSAYLQEYKANIVSRAKDELISRRRETVDRQELYTLQTAQCPQCAQNRSELDRKIADWREEKKDLKTMLEKIQDKYETQREHLLQLQNKASDNVHLSEKINTYENKIIALETKLNTEQTLRHQMELDKMILSVKMENVAKPDETTLMLRKMIMDKGFAEISSPKTAGSETLQIIKQVAETAPDLLEKGAHMIKEMRSDRDPNANPYPPEQRKYQGQVPAPRRAGVQAPPVPRQAAPPVEPSPAPATPQDSLNPLGRGFHNKYPDIPVQLVQVVSEHIMEAYKSAPPKDKAQIMVKTFTIVTNLRAVGVHIKNIMFKKPYPVLNRCITAEEAAEIVWKERPKLANELKQTEYDELIGLLYPLRQHPIYGKDVNFFSQKDVGELIEKILLGIKNYKPKSQVAKAPTKAEQNAAVSATDGLEPQGPQSAPENYDEQAIDSSMERSFGEEKQRWE
jgi:hypothetical protein